MIEINLLDEDRKNLLRENRRNRKTRKFCIIIITSCLAALIVLAVIFTILKISDSSLSVDIEKNKAALNDLRGSELDRNLNLQNILNNIQGLHDKKQIFSPILDSLWQLNVGAEYRNILVNNDGTITVTGLASDFSMLDTLKKFLKNAEVSFEFNGQKNTGKLFNSVEITEGATEIDKRVNFRINLEYNAEVLRFGVINVALVKKGGEK